VSSDLPHNEVRTELEREADVARARLVNTIERLDRRRHDALDWRLQARKHSGELVLVGGAVVATVGVPVAIAIYRASTQTTRLRDERIRALTRFWEHPERVAVKRKRALGWFTTTVLLVAAGAAFTAVARQRRGRTPAQFAPEAPVEPLGI